MIIAELLLQISQSSFKYFKGAFLFEQLEHIESLAITDLNYVT